MESNSTLVTRLLQVVATFKSAKLRKHQQLTWEQKLTVAEPDLMVLEEATQKLLGLAGRELLEAEVQRRAAKVDAEWAARPSPLKCATCGRTLSRHEVQSRQVASSVGELSFNRQVYRCPKCGTMAPADVALGLKPGQRETPRLELLQSEFGAQVGSFQLANTMLRLTLEITPAVATTAAATVREGLAHREWENQLAELARGNSRAVPLVPHAVGEGGVAEDLFIAIDGGMVPCLRDAKTVAKAAAETAEETSARLKSLAIAAATATSDTVPPTAEIVPSDASSTERQTAEQRARKRPKTQHREMKVAAMYRGRDAVKTLNPKRPDEESRVRILKSLNVARIAPWTEFAAVVYAMALSLGARQARRIVVLSDGAKWINWIVLNFLTGLCKEVVHVLDIWHALEHLAEPAKKVFGESTVVLRKWLNERRLELRAGQFDRMLEALRALTALRPGDAELKKLVENKVRYFKARRDQMRYDVYLANGWPIGSGLIEGRIQHVVKGRLDLTGMRWDESTANAVAAKRCEIANRPMLDAQAPTAAAA